MPKVQNSSPASPLLAHTVSLPAADIITSNSIPPTIVPAAGSGKIIEVFGVALVYNFGSAEFDSASSGFLVEYANTVTGTIVGNLGSVVTGPASRFVFTLGTGSNTNALQTDLVNQAILLKSLADFNLGPIANSNLGAGGAGYAPNDTGVFTDGDGNATYKVLTVGAGGAVLTYLITDRGGGYTVENGSPTATGGAQPGVGAGFTVNITAVTLGDGTLKVTTYYSISTVP